MAGTELWLIRHGVTAWNRDRRFQGHRDIALHPDGHRQASRLGQRLARESLAAVYTSDLQRARDTAAPVAARVGRSAVADRALRERCYGAFEGRTHEEIRDAYPDAFARWQARDPDYELPGGGESLRAFAARCADGFERIAVRHAGERIAVVCHGGVLDIGYRLATGEPLEGPRRHELLNASINRIAYAAGRWSLLDWGDVTHLDEALDDAETQPIGAPGIAAGGAGR